MEFPSLPKFLSSRHSYGRLYDATHHPSSSSPSRVTLNKKNLKSLLLSKSKFWKSSTEKFLLICRENGHLKDLQKILNKKGHIIDEQTLIDGYHLVTYYGHDEIMRYFIQDLRIPVDSRTKDGHTSLHLACMKNHLEIVKYLCQHGADVNAVTHDGATPLHWAAFKGNYDCVKYLLEKTSASPHMVTVDGCTALHYACCSETQLTEGGNIHLAKLLVCDYGVPVNCVNQDGDTPLHFVSFLGNQMMMRFLINSGNADLRVKDRAGYTPLHIAAARGHTKCVQLLLAAPNLTSHPKATLLFEFDGNNQSPLHLACRENQADCVTLILQYLSVQTSSFCSEYLHYYTMDGSTGLHLAASRNSLRVIQLLLSEYKSWISVDVLDRNGNTPLHIAVSRGQLDTVILLIESYEANKFALNNKGESPLYIACSHGFGRIVQYFIQSGVEIHQKTHSGLTSLHIACSNGHSHIVQYLLQQDGVNRENTGDVIHNSSPLIIASANGHLELVKYLLDRAMVSLFSTDTFGRSSLHWASQNGHVKVTQYLIECAQESDCLQQFLSLRDKDGYEASDLSVSSEVDNLLRPIRRK